MDFFAYSRSKKPLVILGLGFASFFFAGAYDRVCTFYLVQHPWERFTKFMSQSVFEGGGFGGSDIGVVIPILAFFVWLWCRKSTRVFSAKTSENLKFIFLSGIFGPFAVVTTLKWAVSRARPNIFLADELLQKQAAAIDLWTPGFLGVTAPRGYSWNSFPSGHTSTCAVLLVFAYLAWFGEFAGRKALSIAIFVGVGALVALMAVARSMAGMHWISDSVAAFFIVWLVVDYMWFWRCRKLNEKIRS